MYIFNTDLDNTIIYSYKHNIGNEKINVEIYKDRQISFITKKTHEYLKKLKKKILIVPTTTRDINQYKRINLDIGNIKYALVCNGGVLLIDNNIDEKWYAETIEMIKDCKIHLQESIKLLESENIQDIRLIQDLFVFTKCENINSVMEKLRQNIDTSMVDILNNREKLYIIPKNLNKRNAVLRFKKYINENSSIICAGDSLFDIPMLDIADYSLAPYTLSQESKLKDNVIILNDKIFSDELLEYIDKKIIKDNIFSIAKRENNKKRNFLIVNKYQGKHIPVAPSEAFCMFNKLADKLKDYKNKKLLVIGFCETATAIGVTVAHKLNKNYISTTREIIENVDFIEFSEEHSHATEQKIVKNDIDTIINTIDEILFVEDEITTGNTILNIIDTLSKIYTKNIKYTVASLINCMKDEHIKIYEQKNIKIVYLEKVNNTNFSSIADNYITDGLYKKYEQKKSAYTLRISDYIDIRRIVNISEYITKCEKMTKNILSQIDISGSEKILLLGTEEFMYPALYLSYTIEKLGKYVRFHATTRSPISVSKDNEYILYKRYEINSFYDEKRTNYIYNLEKYDIVIIVTDTDKNLENPIISALQDEGNRNIIVVRWR